MFKSKKIITVDASSLYSANVIRKESFNSSCKIIKAKDGKEIEIKTDLFTGTLTPSLELIELERKINSKGNKTKAIINVTFKCGLKDEGISKQKIKEYLYINGFELDNEKYVLYKRSSAKSRVERVLFIRETLFKPMITWSWLGLKQITQQCDNMAGFKAYESLTSSTIVDTININLDSILLVNDYDSSFITKAMVTKLEKGRLITEQQDDYKMTNSIWDGQSLIQSELIEGKCFTLLRARWLKTCAFSCNIQQFFKDYYKDNYNDAMVKDMFGREKKAKDIKLIMCPSSLKFLKLADIKFKGNKQQCYDYWLSHVESKWGICKWEHPSKYGHGEYQRMSYQMINALNLADEDLKILVADELEYISNIKNDIRYFKQHINKNDNSPTRQAITNLLNINTNLQHTKLFRQWKDNTINKEYINSLKKGKIKVKGQDYYTVCGNPIELLYYVVGDFNGTSKTFKGQEICCNRFEDNEPLGGIRNPCINQGNTYYCTNKKYDEIIKYMKLDGNVVVVNCIETYIDARLGGMDRDSDTVLLFSNDIIVKAIKDNMKYLTPVTDIHAENIMREWNNKSMYELDNLISDNWIGKIVNLSQKINSQYWEKFRKDNSNERVLSELYMLSCTLSIASMLEIDKAKKLINIDMKKMIQEIEMSYSIDKMVKKDGNVGKKVKQPLFFTALGKKRKNCFKMNCPMDNLFNIIKENNPTQDNDNITYTMEQLLISDNVSNADYNQQPKIIELINKYDKKYRGLKRKLSNENNDIHKKIINEEIQRQNDKIVDNIRKLKINQCTMLSILRKIDTEYSNIGVILLSVLFKAKPNVVMDCFKKIAPINESLLEDKDGDIIIFGDKFKTI